MLFKQKEATPYNEKKIVDHIRSLGLDMIAEAQSGHPGIVLGAAPILYTLFAKHLRVNPNDPDWVNRDRFVMSCGHGSALLYATMFMAGYPLTIDDLKKFRKLDSLTPGHPEYRVTPGVEMSTGPLGQGFASAVGMAMAEEYLRSYFEEKKMPLIDHYTYTLVGDGDLMEGVSYEAASLAGTLKLSRLIVLYDSNHISLDGDTAMTFTESVQNRFIAAGWNVIGVEDGENLSLIDVAIEKAKEKKDAPTLIIVKTTIGKYSKGAGTSKVHGTPLSEEDLLEVKKQLDVRDIPFTVSGEAITDFQAMIQNRVQSGYQEYQTMVSKLKKDLISDYERLKNLDLSFKVSAVDYQAPENGKEATRLSSSKVLQSIEKKIPFFLGGSADLASSTKTYLDGAGDFTSTNRSGKNIWFGVREHAMGAIQNGMLLSGLRVFSSTFLSFSDYLRPAIRLAALMNLPAIYIFTHDSVSIGEDGPTHQPVEQLASLRMIPNLEVFRPADANEVIGIYKLVLAKKEGPSVIILGRNSVTIQQTTSVNEVNYGAYIVREEEKELQGILLATGEEVEVALQVASRLLEKGIELRVVSVPSIERFQKQSEEYQKNILPVQVPILALEKGCGVSWYPFVTSKDHIFSIETFGRSGSRTEVERYFEMDLDHLINKIEKLFR